MPWVLGPVHGAQQRRRAPRLRRNCLLCVEDYTFTRTAEQFGISSNSNLYNRAVRTTPGWTNVWSSGSPTPRSSPR